MSTTRKDIQTIGPWTLERREFSSGEHYYAIKADSKTAVDLFINERTDHKTKRTTYTIEYTPSSRSMDLEEAAEFAAHAQLALAAANEFQRVIDAAESN